MSQYKAIQTIFGGGGGGGGQIIIIDLRTSVVSRLRHKSRGSGGHALPEYFDF